MISRPWPTILPVRNVRIARPTDQLDDVARFYREGLGLPELDRFAGHAGYRGVLFGLPGTQYHLEFTQHDHGSPGPAPERTGCPAAAGPVARAGEAPRVRSA